jgi:hypothetical protein
MTTVPYGEHHYQRRPSMDIISIQRWNLYKFFRARCG